MLETFHSQIALLSNSINNSSNVIDTNISDTLILINGTSKSTTNENTTINNFMKLNKINNNINKLLSKKKILKSYSVMKNKNTYSNYNDDVTPKENSSKQILNKVKSYTTVCSMHSSIYICN
jgi:hypothetical protein